MSSNIRTCRSTLCVFMWGLGCGWCGLAPPFCLADGTSKLDGAAAAGAYIKAAVGSRNGAGHSHPVQYPGQQAQRTERLSDRPLPVRLTEEAADQLPQLGRDVVPAPNPVAGQHHHEDVGANPRVEQKVPRRKGLLG